METTNILRKAATLALTLILGLVFCRSVLASPYTPPYIFVPNTLIQSSQVNANFSQAASVINNLDNSNIGTNAAIDPNKLSHVIAFPTLLMSGAAVVTVSVGQTGDTFPRLEIVSDGSLRMGPGAGINVDVGLYRTGVGELSVRNGDNTADGNLKVGNLTASGSFSFTTPLNVANGGTGRNTLTAGSYLKGDGTNQVALQVAPIPITDGGTGATSLTGDGVVVMNAGGTAQTTVAPGGKNNVLSSDGTTWTSHALLGGTGADGALNLTAGMSPTPPFFYKNATTVSTASSFKSNVFINATSTVQISTDLDLSASTCGFPGPGNQGASVAGQDGYGPGAGKGGAQATFGGGGGGAGAWTNGGDGGSAVAGSSGTGGKAPPVFGNLVGSSGGNGGTGASGSHGSGGDGAGTIKIVAADAISIAGTGGNPSIVCNGTTGSAGLAGTAGGSGGGGAGTVFLYSLVSISGNSSATIGVAGGNGGAGIGSGGDGGGGGGGGIAVAYAPILSNLLFVTAASSGGAGTIAGSAGGAGTSLSITGTPTLPLIAFHDDIRGLKAHLQLLAAGNILKNQSTERLTSTDRSHCQAVAAFYAKPGQFDNLCMALMHGGDESTAQFACVDVSESFKRVKDTCPDAQKMERHPVAQIGVGDAVANELEPAV